MDNDSKNDWTLSFAEAGKANRCISVPEIVKSTRVPSPDGQPCCACHEACQIPHTYTVKCSGDFHDVHVLCIHLTYAVVENAEPDLRVILL